LLARSGNAVCCVFGSNQTLSYLIKHYPDQVWEHIFKPCVCRNWDPRRLAISYAVYNNNVEAVAILLNFVRHRAKTHDRWSSKQLLSLDSFDIMIKRFLKTARYTAQMVRLLLEFEASQTGAHFPQRHGEDWTSKLVQGLPGRRLSSLQIASQFGEADMVRVLLEAGARSSMSSVGPTPLARALTRHNPQKGSKVVKSLLLNDPSY
jgi:hypothetical protein